MNAPQEQLQEFRMSYDDRLTEEAWAIAGSRRIYEAEGIQWNPSLFNIVTIDVADLLTGRSGDLRLTIPDDQDYHFARIRLDEDIAERQNRFERLQRAKTLYCCPPDAVYIAPWSVELNASWNGMRDPLPVDEFLYMAGVSDDEAQTIFHYDPVNVPVDAKYNGGYYGFSEGGKQKLANMADKPIAFVSRRSGRFAHWDLSSKKIFLPVSE